MRVVHAPIDYKRCEAYSYVLREEGKERETATVGLSVVPPLEKCQMVDRISPNARVNPVNPMGLRVRGRYILITSLD